jgi:hypothetical protein
MGYHKKQYWPRSESGVSRNGSFPCRQIDRLHFLFCNCLHSSSHQDVGQNPDVKIANRSSENVSQVKRLGTRVTNQNLIQAEIKSTSNSGSALLPFRPETPVFSSVVETRENCNTQEYNFACLSACV